MINVLFLIVNIAFCIILKKYFNLDYEYRKLYLKCIRQESELEYYRNRYVKEDEE